MIKKAYELQQGQKRKSIEHALSRIPQGSKIHILPTAERKELREKDWKYGETTEIVFGEASTNPSMFVTAQFGNILSLGTTPLISFEIPLNQKASAQQNSYERNENREWKEILIPKGEDVYVNFESRILKRKLQPLELGEVNLGRIRDKRYQEQLKTQEENARKRREEIEKEEEEMTKTDFDVVLGLPEPAESRFSQITPPKIMPLLGEGEDLESLVGKRMWVRGWGENSRIPLTPSSSRREQEISNRLAQEYETLMPNPNELEKFIETQIRYVVKTKKGKHFEIRVELNPERLFYRELDPSTTPKESEDEMPEKKESTAIREMEQEIFSLQNFISRLQRRIELERIRQKNLPKGESSSEIKICEEAIKKSENEIKVLKGILERKRKSTSH